MRLAALALALWLAGCASGTRPYGDGGLPKNLTVRTASTAKASLDVHAVDAGCAATYLGSVALDEPQLALGIPAGRWSWLEFTFASSGFFGPKTQTSRGTLLYVRPDARYEAAVTYRDDIYGVVLRELPARGAARELPFLPFAACR